jgi:two-component system, chemotaxis family, protein-glutamate methylesterase/glutaminase
LTASPKARVLIVDDAVVVRKALTDALARDPALEVVGTASNGRLALTKFTQLRPDIVLLDIEMPEMNGLETVPEIRKLDRRVPIVMFSTLTERGSEATLEALSRGATDYVTKPSNTDMESTFHRISDELIPKIKAFCHVPASLPSAWHKTAGAAASQSNSADPQGANGSNPSSRSGHWGFYWRP